MIAVETTYLCLKRVGLGVDGDRLLGSLLQVRGDLSFRVRY